MHTEPSESAKVTDSDKTYITSYVILLMAFNAVTLIFKIIAEIMRSRNATSLQS